jgi:hypothetical protein
MGVQSNGTNVTNIAELLVVFVQKMLFLYVLTWNVALASRAGAASAKLFLVGT